MKKDFDETEGILRGHLTDSANLAAAHTEPPNGAAIDLGGVVLVLLETAWGWLGEYTICDTLYPIQYHTYYAMPYHTTLYIPFSVPHHTHTH